ncbi:MAG: carbohydrate-binding protein [Oscillospiraceae bacterium]|jgi:hypothetical protein|nr:carbohydrate-binding protein [Oscillospiraceae bacterium]
MNLSIQIVGASGAVKAGASGAGGVRLVYAAPYAEGDRILLSADRAGDVVAQLEDSLPETFGYLAGPFVLPVPFGEKRISYSPKQFAGEVHLLWAREAEPRTRESYRNLALNPLDSHENEGLFPHAAANVETRGESVFAARNAVNGNTTSAGHGAWPYESWGINQRADAALTVSFGRPVVVDKLVLTLRADFPHDNWWTQATVLFSDGTRLTPLFEKHGLPQAFAVPPRTVEWVTLCEMKKDETDPSPFPALVQLECWGYVSPPRPRA